MIDANQAGWGCSGRNAGFILPGSGRLDYAGLKAAYGDAVAQHTLDNYYRAMDTLSTLLEATRERCDLTNGGYLKIGHSQAAFQQLCSSMHALPGIFQQQYQKLSATEVNELIPDYPNYGGIYRPQGQGLNPLKFSSALMAHLTSLNIPMYGNTPAINIDKVDGAYQVATPGGCISAKNLVICSNAYSLPSLYRPVTQKQFPVLSSVLVSEPISDAAVLQWQAGLMAMDTRSLKYYFRLLPDNRILFGGRGAITGKHANTAESQHLLKGAFNRYFPTLAHLNGEFFWSGWVSVSADNIPHVTKVAQENIFYATGYCGSGLSFSCHAGQQLTTLLMGNTYSMNKSAYHSPLPAFPLAIFRRTGLYCYYQWHRAIEKLFG